MEAQTLFGRDGTQWLHPEWDPAEEKIFLRCLGIPQTVGVSPADVTYLSVPVATGAAW